MKAIKKSLYLIKSKMHLKQTFITYKELVFCLTQIPKDIITSYTSLHFLLDKAINPPITKSYINPAAFHQKSRSTILQKIQKTIIFFNTKAQAIEVYKKTLEYLKLLHLMYYMDDIGSSILAMFY